MALSIGGLSQAEALEALGISRATMSRFRKRASWPGDDASWSHIAAWVKAEKGSAGRKPDKPATAAAGTSTAVVDYQPPLLDPDADESYEDQVSQWDLGDQLRISQIEKNNRTTDQYQANCMAKHRADLTTKIVKVLDKVFDAVDRMDLSREQQTELRNVIKQCASEVADDDAGDFQPELLTE